MRRLGATLVLVIAVAAAWAAPSFASEAPIATQPFNTATDTQLGSALDTAIGTTDMTTFEAVFPGEGPAGADYAVKAAQAGSRLPALAALDTIALGAGAFAAGWFVGSTLNRYFHISSSIVGTVPTGGTGDDTLFNWRYHADLCAYKCAGTFGFPGLPASAGWTLNSGSGRIGYHPGGGDAADTHANAIAASIGASSAVNNSDSTVRMYYVSAATMSAAVQVKPETATTYGGESRTYSAPGGDYVPGAITSTQAAAIRSALSGQPTSEGRDFINRIISPGYAPLPVTATVPDCVGLSQSACTAAFASAGFTHAPSYSATDIYGAVITRPAGAIITQPLAPGTTQPLTVTLPTFTTNPATMPILLPQPQPNERYDEYLARIRALGLTGTVNRVALAPEESDVHTGPEGASRVRIETTTGTQLLTRVAWPVPSPRVTPSSTVTIYTNPETAPDADTTPGSGSSGGPGGGSGIDFGPLGALNPGCVFPFGLFCYAKAVTDALTADPLAPAFHFTFPSIGGHLISGGGHYDVDLADVPGLDGYMAIWRTLLSVALWVGAVWMLASRLLGLQLGDPGEAVDDA